MNVLSSEHDAQALFAAIIIINIIFNMISVYAFLFATSSICVETALAVSSVLLYS